MPKKRKQYYGNIDFTGYKHDRLTVIEKSTQGKSKWICRCDCGNEVELTPYYFKTYRSCGCLEKENRENLGSNNITHGMTETRLYHVWTEIKDRCYNPNAKQFVWYGARNIRMCKEWNESFEAFEKWAYANGYDDKLNGNQQSIDRINVDDDYCPDNCRWVNHKEQMRNTTRNVYLMDNGEEMCISDFCERHNITYCSFVRRRLEKGMDPSDILRDWNFSNGKHDGYYTLDEATEVYSVCKQSLMNWINKKWIHGEKIGHHWYIPKGQSMPIKATLQKRMS